MQLSDFDDRNRALGDRLLLHIRHVRVNVCGRGDIRMTEPFLNLLEGKALLEQERRDRMPLRYNNDKQKKPLFSRGLSVCRLLFNSFSKLKIDENYKEKRRLFY